MRALTHVVAGGESLTSLAERFGVSSEALRAANHLTTDELRPGQPLVIPTVPGDFSVEAFPAWGWVPGRAWLRAEQGESAADDPPHDAGEHPRAPVVDRLWHIKAPFAWASLALVDHLFLALTVSPGRPSVGQPATLRLLTVNVGCTPLVLRYPTTQRAEFVVFQRDREVFRASEGRAYAQVLQEVTLRPGQSELAVERFVPGGAGTYRVVAVNLALRAARMNLSFEVV